jgi:hypothetical protein
VAVEVPVLELDAGPRIALGDEAAFGVDRMVEQYVDVYEQVLRRR